ncbi:DbpA RNA binding domain-containing protein [Parasphaerochaeta coccoides]|uniref:DbpA RNA-binding domain protein n=1 Tax=Parasphaerochaeta coccoides (strain ATCC BAA-1237 / DSM 17374 / SPN1) TaxID=760011 RepID=F4GH48_PARC1|nr:DbpA RNA binding domain-containing protein [Parasphaerochaeta coccoides]AEC01523.1 DbpA RNA-binding domain protein [Parasphaerochaeta coccoides DSM 17374]
MAYDNTDKSVGFDPEILAGKIKELAAQTRSDSNVETLDALRKLIKRNVPFTLRGYFSAYLLRELVTSSSSKSWKPSTERPKQPRTPRPPRQDATDGNSPAADGDGKRSQKPLPEGTRTLYLNIGKMKRLHAKDLSVLLQEKLGITREDILSIRIHDKYTFIAMKEEHCEKAIELLNGIDINGRTVAISYSNRE